MDPLSIIASTIAIAQAVSASLEQVRSFYGAENDVLSLINEVSDVYLILDEFDRTIRERGEHINVDEDRLEAIATILKRSQTQFEELNDIIQNGVFRVNPVTGKHKVGRFSWLHQKSKLKQLQSLLKDTRITLTTLCASTTLSSLSRIHLHLDSFTLLQNDCKAQLTQQSKFMESIVEQYNSISSSSPIENDISDDQSSGELTDTTNPPRWPDYTGSGETYSNIRIRATRYRRTRCDAWCSCCCHRPSTLQTPSVVKLLLGSLFVGYTGIPTLTRKCDEKRCRQQSIPTLKIAYYFPGWFLNRMFRFALSSSQMNGPQVSLSMPRVVPDNSEVFAFAVQGNLNGLRSLFERGVASPFDIGFGTGRSPLHYAVNYDYPHVARFLLDSGADPQVEDMEQATTVALVGAIFLAP